MISLVRRSAAVVALIIVTVLTPSACGKKGDRSAGTVDTIVRGSQTGSDSNSGGVLTVPPGTIDTATPPVVPIVFPFPATILAADSAAGQRIYRREAGCIACHGGRGEGVANLGSSLADTAWSRGEGSLSFLYSTIRDGITGSGGRGAMPASQGSLSPREIFQVAAYVYTLSRPGSTIADSTMLAAGAPGLARAPADTSRH